MTSERIEDLAGIQYVGLPGISQECQAAVARMLQYGDRITNARILTADRDHCLLLIVCRQRVWVPNNYFAVSSRRSRLCQYE